MYRVTRKIFWYPGVRNWTGNGPNFVVSLRLILVCSKAFGPLLGALIVKGPEYSSENKKYVYFFGQRRILRPESREKIPSSKWKPNSRPLVRTLLSVSCCRLFSKQDRDLIIATPVIEDFTSWIGDLLETLTEAYQPGGGSDFICLLREAIRECMLTVEILISDHTQELRKTCRLMASN